MTNITISIAIEKRKLLKYIALEKDTTVSNLIRKELYSICEEE